MKQKKKKSAYRIKQEKRKAEYLDFIKNNKMTDKERHLLREWFKAGNSVYESEIGWCIDQLSFLRIVEEFRPKARGMSFDEALLFLEEALGWYQNEQLYALTACVVDEPIVIQGIALDECDIPF